jgi:hypothetical protein
MLAPLSSYVIKCWVIIGIVVPSASQFLTDREEHRLDVSSGLNFIVPSPPFHFQILSSQACLYLHFVGKRGSLVLLGSRIISVRSGWDIGGRAAGKCSAGFREPGEGAVGSKQGDWDDMGNWWNTVPGSVSLLKKKYPSILSHEENPVSFKNKNGWKGGATVHHVSVTVARKHNYIWCAPEVECLIIFHSVPGITLWLICSPI